MKIKESRLKQIIKEETLKRIRVLREDSDFDDKVVDADKDNKDKKKEKDKSKPPSPDKKDSKPKSNDKPKPKKEPELPGVSPGEDIEADSKGNGIGDQITGMTVLSFTMDPRSKTVPGALELTLQFKENPQPLKIFVVGKIKFLYKGSLQGDLGTDPTTALPSSVEDNVPVPGSEEELA